MSVLMLLAAFGRRAYVPTVYTKTFTASEVFTMPAGVTVLDSVEGVGAPGTASYSDPDTPISVEVVRVFGSDASGGTTSQVKTWDFLTIHVNQMVQKVNAGGTGADLIGKINYTQYVGQFGSANTAIISYSSLNWDNAVAGSAYPSYTGWTFSGNVGEGDNGRAYINYSKRGTFYPATTGASASGFGKTFAGGSGGPGVVSGHTNVPVSPGAPYQVTVPPGGSITIKYRK